MKRIVSIMLSIILFVTVIFVDGAIIMGTSAAELEALDVFKNASFEEEKYNATSNGVTPGEISVDDTTAYDGEKSFKVVAKGNDSGSNIILETKDGALNGLDINVAYKIQFKAKATEDYRGFLSFEMDARFGTTQLNSLTTFHSNTRYSKAWGVWGFSKTNVTQKEITGIESNWTTYESGPISIIGDKIYFTLFARGNSGTVWFDDFKLVPCQASSDYHGKVIATYDTTNNNVVLTAEPDAGYKVNSIGVKAGYINTSGQWIQNQLIPVTEGDKLVGGKVTYTFNFNTSLAQSGKYEVYTYNDIKLINATFVPSDDIATIASLKLENGGFETKTLTGVSNAGAIKGMASLDTTTSAEGEKSLKIESLGANSGADFTLSTFASELANLDANLRYQIKFKAKATEDYRGSIIFRQTAYYGSTKVDVTIRHNNRYSDTFSVYGYTGSNRTPETLTTEWETYTSAPFSILGDKMSFGFVTRGESGAVWFDDFEIVAYDDGSENGGIVKTSYDSNTGKVIATAIPDEGYKLSGLGVVCGVKNNWLFEEIPLTEIQTDVEGATAYAFTFVNGAKQYEIYTFDSYKLFNATFVKSDPTDVEISLKLENGGFETPTLTGVSNAGAIKGVASLDTTTSSEGEKSLKIESPGAGSGADFTLSTYAGAVANLDANLRYQIKFKAKATTDYTGSLMVRQSAYYGSTKVDVTIRHNNRYSDTFSVYGYTGNNRTPEALTTEWETYTSAPFSILGDKMSFGFVTRGESGAVWFDDFEIVAYDDGSENGGIVKTSYDSKTGNIIATAIAKEGYTLEEFNVICGVKNNWKFEEVPLTEVDNNEERQKSYSFNFKNGDTVYEIYTFEGYRLFNASFLADGETSKPKNVLKNGGFEDGMWSTFGSDSREGKKVAQVSDETHNSKFAGKLSSTTDETEVYIVSENILEMDPSKTYTLSVSVKTQDVGMDCVYFRIGERYPDAAGDLMMRWKTVYGQSELLETGGTQDWTTYTVNISGWNENLEGIWFYAYLKGKGTVWLDNIYLSERVFDADLEVGVVGSDKEEGELKTGDSVTLFTADDTADIYYTVDGSDPKTSQTSYLFDEGYGIPITKDTTVKAVAYSEEAGFGEIAEFSYTCPPLVDDEKLWNNIKVKASASLDKTVKKDGEASIKLKGNGSKIDIATDVFTIDSRFDYKISFYIKTENMILENGPYFSIFMACINSNPDSLQGFKGVYYVDEKKLCKIEKTQDWTYYEFVLDEMRGNFTGIGLVAGIDNDMGTMWIDGVSVEALPLEKFPVTVKGDDVRFGNIYEESTISQFVIEQGFLISNVAKSIETGKLSYTVTNDVNPDIIISTGDMEQAVRGKATTGGNVNLSTIAEYGTFTVSFTFTNSNGKTYPAGSIAVSRIMDSTKLTKNNLTAHGVNCNFMFENYRTLEDVEEWFDNFAAAGIGIIRASINIEDIEVSKGEYKLPERVYSVIDMANERGIEIYMVLNSRRYASDGGSAFPNTPEEMEYILSFVRYVANELKGKVKYYELYNEPNYMPYSKTDGAGYVRFLKEFYTELKKIDSDVLVVGGASSGFDHTWNEEIFRAGGADYMDCFSFHPYAYPDSPETGKWKEQVEELKAIQLKYSDKDLPFISSEMGWTAVLTELGCTEQQKLDYLVRTMVHISSLDYMKENIIYNTYTATNKYYLEAEWGLFGNATTNEIETVKGAAKPVTAGLAALGNMLNGYKFVGEENFVNGLYTYKYSSEKKDMYIIWTNDVEHKAQITVTDKAKLYDIFGNVQSIEVINNTFETGVGGKIIYVVMDKGESIKSITLDGKLPVIDNNIIDDNDIENTYDNENADNVIVNPDNSIENSTDNSDQDDSDNTTTTKKVIKKKYKKVIKGGESGDSFNWLPVIIASCAAAALLFVIILIVIKRHKKKQI